MGMFRKSRRALMQIDFAKDPEKWTKEQINKMMGQAACNPMTGEQVVGELLSTNFEEIRKKKRENFKEDIYLILMKLIPPFIDNERLWEVAEEIVKATFDEGVVN